MAIDIIMPNTGFDSQTSRLIEWLKAPGDPVARGETLAIVESDKAEVELEALAGGVLLEHSAAAGAEVTVGAVIGRIGSVEEYRARQSAAAPSAPAPAARVSPVARRMARQHNIALEQVAGSGAGGRIMRRDIEALAAPAPAAAGTAGVVLALPRVRRAARERGIALPAVLAAGYASPITLAALEDYARQAAPGPAPADDVTVVPLTRMRQSIGQRLGASMREAPHFYVTGEFLFDQALARLKTLPGPPRINDLLAFLVTRTLLRVPRLNATLGAGAVHQYRQVHLALAVALPEGLLTPVLRDAGQYALPELSRALGDLVARARQQRLSAAELHGGTFTLSNLGMVRQVDHFTAVINPPQVAIVAIGALKPRPVVLDGGLFVRQTAHLTLSGDHRAVDGSDLARFMQLFGEELEHFGS